MRIAFVVLMGGCLLPGCAPVDQKTCDLLAPQQSKELRTWSTNHAIVFDLRLHSMKTCPFLTYLPNAGSKHGLEWAEWAHEFYHAKHVEEKHCKCDADLAAWADAGAGPLAGQ